MYTDCISATLLWNRNLSPFEGFMTELITVCLGESSETNYDVIEDSQSLCSILLWTVLRQKKDGKGNISTALAVLSMGITLSSQYRSQTIFSAKFFQQIPASANTRSSFLKRDPI